MSPFRSPAVTEDDRRLVALVRYAVREEAIRWLWVILPVAAVVVYLSR